MNTANYILLDAARMELNIEEAKKLNPEFLCLYRGKSEQDLECVAPYIFTFKQNTAFANWYYENGWGDAWGILLNSAYSLEDLYKHFRKFLMVQTEDKEELYFRFYDPRVLRIFLPTCDKEQLKEFFGHIVNSFVMEDNEENFSIQFWLENYQLQSRQTNKDEIVKLTPKEISASNDTKDHSIQENIPNTLIEQAPPIVQPAKNNKNSFNIFLD